MPQHTPKLKVGESGLKLVSTRGTPKAGITSYMVLSVSCTRATQTQIIKWARSERKVSGSGLRVDLVVDIEELAKGLGQLPGEAAWPPIDPLAKSNVNYFKECCLNK